jgi:hypothetical protein
MRMAEGRACACEGVSAQSYQATNPDLDMADKARGLLAKNQDFCSREIPREQIKRLIGFLHSISSSYMAHFAPAARQGLNETG